MTARSRLFVCLLTVGVALLMGWSYLQGEVSAVGALGLTGLMLVIAVLHWRTGRSQRFCKCGALVTHPRWRVHFEACPNCGRFVHHPDAGLGAGGELDLSHPGSLAAAPPVLKLFSLVLTLAVKDRATRVLFEPGNDRFAIKYLVDGVMYDLVPPPAHLQRAIAGMAKVVAGLDPDVEDRVQQGEFRFILSECRIEVGVAIEPNGFGEKVVLEMPDIDEPSSATFGARIATLVNE